MARNEGKPAKRPTKPPMSMKEYEKSSHDKKADKEALGKINEKRKK